MDGAYRSERASSVRKQVKKKGKHPTLSSLEDQPHSNGGKASNSLNELLCLIFLYAAEKPHSIYFKTSNCQNLIEIQSYSHWYLHRGMVQASVLIGLPCEKDSRGEFSITFKGEPANTEDEAKEKAAQVALECICANYNISISDHNYYALEVTKERLFTSKEMHKQRNYNLTSPVSR
ncbi:hypothetical protein VPH35_136177 [Triticum aestivum]